MLEDLGKCAGNKHSEAMVQIETLGDGLNNHNLDNNQSLSGTFWNSEIEDTLNNLKQFESKQKLAELLKVVQDSKPGLIEAAKTDRELQRILNRETLAEKVKRMLEEKPIEIIDCGFGRALERQGKAELDESVRRLNKIDLRPLFWNVMESRR
jgi:hypothetical protein